MSDRTTSLPSSLVLAIGFIIAAVLIGGSLRDMRKADRYVSVKGLVEREVVADLAVWTIKTSVAGNDLPAAQQQIDANVAKVKSFLNTNGFGNDAIESGGIRVVDRKAREYDNANANQARYIIEATMVLRSTDVMRVVKVSQLTSDLVKTGVTLGDENSCNKARCISIPS